VPTRGGTSADDVFINCPFDLDYAATFQALIFTIYACGFRPRSARELDDAGQTRIEKLFNLIHECRYGIHDLSRTDLDATFGLPRFNMPLELGIFLALSASAARRRGRNVRSFSTSSSSGISGSAQISLGSTSMRTVASRSGPCARRAIGSPTSRDVRCPAPIESRVCTPRFLPTSRRSPPNSTSTRPTSHTWTSSGWWSVGSSRRTPSERAIGRPALVPASAATRPLPPEVGELGARGTFRGSGSA
jgi:hypothetical protein